jgi:hypothetical protein
MRLSYDLSCISRVCLLVPFVVLREDSDHTEMVEWHYLYEKESARERERNERESHPNGRMALLLPWHYLEMVEWHYLYERERARARET